MKVWDANNKYNCIRTINISGYSLSKFLILKNGYFVIPFYDTIMIWNSISLKSVNTLEHDFYPTHIKLLEDNRILCCSFYGKILIWSY
jgi:hypothetical protein